jgi:hypothetical protein
MKNSSDTIGNRTRDLPACSAVPQPTAPLRVPSRIMYRRIKLICFERCGFFLVVGSLRVRNSVGTPPDLTDKCRNSSSDQHRYLPTSLSATVVLWSTNKCKIDLCHKGGDGTRQLYLTLNGLLSRWTRQLFPRFQIQCRAQFDAMFHHILFRVSFSSGYVVIAFNLWKYEIFWKIYLDQNFGNHKNC